ncbi:MAG TPA: hypothetical protein VN047_01340 [Sphingopyxis sp.]|uniref:hypothetical protein n=1 Tax=Sphingopyxis sp. TaxID=1908224 RepID=UPI002B8CF5F1|nr:hypothetical protein [Sphingopyxis sp.]HWW55515.1 hypothetical protein [Sphingopyxis sp.]
MADRISNDNDLPFDGGREGREPDAHGQAAMLLVESLIHALVAKSLLSVGEAVDVVDTAAEVKEAIAPDLGDSPDTLEKSLSLLRAISTSLSADLSG